MIYILDFSKKHVLNVVSWYQKTVNDESNFQCGKMFKSNLNFVTVHLFYAEGTSLFPQECIK